ncbi:hypothetical protein DJ71_22310 [Halorubrum sp. E3]|nr:hypothetical protein DJ71_22310 [Halorubrum sp. E3]
MNMYSKLDLSSIESQLNADTNGRINIEQMGDDANVYYDITDAQSTRYTVATVLIGKEPQGDDHRSKLMLYQFGEKTVLVVDDPRERQDLLMSEPEFSSELHDLAGRMIEAEIEPDTVPVRIEVSGVRGESVGNWAVETYDDNVEIA